MKHSISNDKLQVTIQSSGAELSSVKTPSGKEYMWNADPDVWGSHAPVLFPIIGCLKDDVCKIEATDFKIPKHGFIRYNDDIKVKNRTHDRINFQLDHSESSLALYPYKFKFNISFHLVGNKLVVSHKVENMDTKPIYFSLGAHPAFKCPVNEGETYSDYYLEFEHEETVETTLLSEGGLISDKTELVLDETNILPLTDKIFNRDALIFKDLKSKRVSLKSNKSDQVLTVRYADFEYLGLWAKPAAPFVCIEPWNGIADSDDHDGDFTKKDGIVKLDESGIYKAQYSIEIEE